MNASLSHADDTRAWGRGFAARLNAGDVVLLFGPLGVGKTTLVVGICEGLGVHGDVLSPTYTLLETYEGRLSVYHFDFYRIDGSNELRATDPREYYRDGVTLMEWPERVRDLWPRARWEIRLAFAAGGRTLTLQRVESP